MIEIQRPEQFTRAAERLQSERMSMRRYERNTVEVTNRAKGHNYLVRFERVHGKTFGTCTCEAGMPTRSRNRVPLVCKHLLAAVLFVRALGRMRRGH
jgi:hypothetical protein